MSSAHPSPSSHTVDTHRGQIVAELRITSTRWNGFMRDYDL